MANSRGGTRTHCWNDAAVEREADMQSLAGTMWKLIEASEFDDEGNKLPPPLGPHPMGFVMFDAERMIVAVCDGRSEPPPNAPPRAFAGYGGRYRFDGTELVTTADSASNPDLLVEQVRHIRFDSPTRMTATPVNLLFGRARGLTFVWERMR
jgi:hypothetical protein